MASGTSEQSVENCIFCITKVTVKCMDCDVFMCDLCTQRNHSKFKNADIHTILKLSEIAEYMKSSENIPLIANQLTAIYMNGNVTLCSVKPVRSLFVRNAYLYQITNSMSFVNKKKD